LEKVKQNDKHKFMNKCIQDKNTQLMRGVFENALMEYAQHLSPERKGELAATCFSQMHYLESIVAIAHPKIDLSRIKAHKWLIVVGK